LPHTLTWIYAHSPGQENRNNTEIIVIKYGHVPIFRPEGLPTFIPAKEQYVLPWIIKQIQQTGSVTSFTLKK
jgi:hypothetical protein